MRSETGIAQQLVFVTDMNVKRATIGLGAGRRSVSAKITNSREARKRRPSSPNVKGGNVAGTPSNLTIKMYIRRVGVKR